MGQSYVRHGTNVVCTNMTCYVPREICRVEKESGIINKASDQPLLNIDDKKISECFVCKMPIKKWGGLLTFLAGVAVGALCVAAIVATGGLAAGVFAAVAISGSMVTAAIAVGTLSAGYAVYRGIKDIAHDCDMTKDASWKKYHEKVFFEKRKALLNHSFMLCHTGGTINIIVNPQQAKKAALYISGLNTMEITLQLQSKLLQGCISGLTGGANPIALGLSVAFYNGWLDFLGGDFGEPDKSNISGSLAKDAENTAKTTGYGMAESSAEGAISLHGEMSKAAATKSAEIDGQVAAKTTEAGIKGSESLGYGVQAADASADAAVWGGEATARSASGASNSSVASAKLAEQMYKESSDELMTKSTQAAAQQQVLLSDAAKIEAGRAGAVKGAKNAAMKNVGKNLAKSIGLGLAGAAVGYVVDEVSNVAERGIEKYTEKISNASDDIDNSDNGGNTSFMGIIANK